jgi:hypothetical protein
VTKRAKKGKPSASEADECRRKAKDAEYAAETAQSAEAKDFFLQVAMDYYRLASSLEEDGR